MATRRAAGKRKVKKSKRSARKPTRRKSKPAKETHFSALIALITLLYVLRLVDTKTYRKFTQSAQPRKRTRPRKRSNIPKRASYKTAYRKKPERVVPVSKRRRKRRV